MNIKFRGVATRVIRGHQQKIGRWVYGYLVRDINGTNYIISEPTWIERENRNSIVFNEIYEVDKDSVGQYVGFKDRRGTEIYSGDIIKIVHNKHYYLVFWHKDGLFTIKEIGRNFITNIPEPNKYGIVDYVEVVGNKFDNPELLEGR